jgi:tetratricopeptide (TPR) repeat protein
VLFEESLTVMTRRRLAALPLALTALFLCPFPGSAEIVPQSASAAPTKGLSAEAQGDLFMARQEYVAALEAYRQAPPNAVTYNKMGMAWHHMLAFDEARKDYEKALLIRPDYPEAINNLGAADFSKGDYRQAIRLYRRAFKLMPESAVIAANLGTAYFARGKYDLGLKAYQKAFALDPTVFSPDSTQTILGPSNAHERARQDFCIAELFARQGEQDLALEYLRKALNDGFDDRHRLLGDSDFAQLRKTAEFAQLMAEEKIH